MQTQTMDIKHILFVSKVERLKTNSFLSIFRGKTFIKFPAVQDPLNWPKIHGISRLTIDSFVLHFRFLIQDRDKISNKVIYADLNDRGVLSETSRNTYFTWQNNKNTDTKVIFNGRSYTHNEIFNIVFFGGLAHVNEEYFDEFVKLSNNPIGTMLVFHSFRTSLNNIYNISRALARDIKNASNN